MKTVQPVQFGKHLLFEPMGTTRVTESFRAVDLSKRFFDGFVLLKRLQPHLATDVKATKILVYEAKVHRELDHPSIVKVLEAGKVRDQIFFTEEHPWGRSLLSVLRQLREQKRTMEPEIALFVAIQVCRALDYAHTHRLTFGAKRFVVHRNLNPRNIWISFDGGVHLYDFGNEPVNVHGPEAAQLDFRMVCGLSPEQINQEYYDHRTDIFALGTILYELLGGVHPFKGKDLKAVQKMILAASPQPLSAHVQIPPELERLVMKCMARNIEDRPPRASSLLLQMEGMLMSMDDTMDKDGLGNWMKNLFQKEIFLEIRSLHEAFSQCLGKGAMVLRSIPAYLFQHSQPRARSGHKTDRTAPAVKTKDVLALEEETRIMLEQDSQASDSMETILIDDEPQKETNSLSMDEERSLVDNYEPPDAHLEDETILLDEKNPPLPGFSRPEPPRPIRNPTLPPHTRAPQFPERRPTPPGKGGQVFSETPVPQSAGSFTTAPHPRLPGQQLSSAPAGQPAGATPAQSRRSLLQWLASLRPEELRMMAAMLILTLLLLVVILVLFSSN